MPYLAAAKNNIPTPLQTRSQRMLRCGRCHILPPKKYITHSRYTAAQKGAAICFCTRYCVSLKNYYLLRHHEDLIFSGDSSRRFCRHAMPGTNARLGQRLCHRNRLPHGRRPYGRQRHHTADHRRQPQPYDIFSRRGVSHSRADTYTCRSDQERCARVVELRRNKGRTRVVTR